MTEPPNRIPWPPLILLAVIAAGLVLHWAAPLPWTGGAARLALAGLGAGLGAFAIAIDLTALRTFRSHNTTIMPHRAARALITTGPFALSRNPIYAGNILIITGAALLFGNLWLLLGAPLAALLIQKLAIAREERHLEEAFGEAWRAYAARTPRWFGF